MARSISWLNPLKVFGKLGIRARVLLCAAVPLAIVVVGAVLALGGLKEVVQATDTLSQSHRSVEQAMAVEALALEMRADIARFLLTGQEPDLQPYKQAREAIDKRLEDLRQAEKTEVGRTALAQAQNQLDAWRKGFVEPGIEARRKAQDARDLNQLRERTSIEEGQRHFQRFRQEMAGFVKQHEQLIAQNDQVLSKRFQITRAMVGVSVPVIVILTLGILYLLSWNIRGLFLQAETLVEAGIGGNLSEGVTISACKEVASLGVALNRLVETLQGQGRQIKNDVSELSESASAIASTGAQLAVSTSRASAAVAQTTSTVEELRQAAQLASEEAKRVARSAQQTMQVVTSGTRATEDTISRMNVVREQMASAAETVVKLSERSRSIEQIIGVVKDLADQSSLLAVNASIEAARAGNEGKGFSVVAQEIKSLADQSKEATEQIRSILQDIQKWVSAVVMATEQGAKAVDAGLEQSVLAGKAIEALAESVATSSQAASVIDAQIEQQVVGVDQVAGAMGDIEAAMQQNLEAALQLEVAAGKLRDLGESMAELMER
ncbi:MAG: methyl-accepting chemotaxis protein [Thermodesulfobacteriota bacterium]